MLGETDRYRSPNRVYKLPFYRELQKILL